MKKQLLSVLIIMAFSIGAFAQSYVYTTTTGTSDPYNVLEGTTTDIMEAPSASGTSLPDQMSSLISIPFTWRFYGNVVTGYYASDNGYIAFDNTVTSNPSNDLPPSASGPNNSIYAFWDDIAIEEGGGATDKVKYWTYGEEPNRVHVVQWHSFTPGDAGVTGSYAYAAIRLYECGDFDIVNGYGNSTGWTATVGCENSDGTDATIVTGSPSLDYPDPATPDGDDDVVYRFYYGAQPVTDLTVMDETGLATSVITSSSNTITGTIENWGSAAVTSLDINYSVDGAAPVTSSVSSVNIAMNGGSYTYSHPTTFSPPTPGVLHTIQVWANNINGSADDMPCNDTLTKTLFVNEGITTSRHVLLEEFTGAWCGWCPDGHTKSDEIVSAYSNVSVVMIHAGTPTDDMKFTESLAIATEFSATSFPGAMIDRVLFDGFDKVPHTRSSNNWENHTAERVNAYSPVDVSISKSYDSGTRVIDATVTADFVDYAAGDIRINLFVVEDNVTGTGSGYDQANYLDGHPDYTTHPLYNAGNPIIGYNHRHVLRAVPSGVPGTSGVIPGIVSPGGEYSQAYSYTLPSDYEETEIELVAFLSYYNSTDRGNNDILNAASSGSITLAINDIASNLSARDFYPNPVSDLGMLSFHLNNTETVLVEVRNMIGQQVKVIRHSKMSAGDHMVAISVSDFSDGIYYVNILAGEQSITKKIVVLK